MKGRGRSSVCFGRRPGHKVGILFFALAGGLLAGCAKALPQSPLDPQGPVARVQAELLSLTLYFAIGIGLFVTAALLFVVWRFRARPGQSAIPKQIHGNHTLEVIWTAIPILILAIVAVPTVQAAFHNAAPPDGSLEIKATGNQWWFAFEYANEGVVTANDLRIPAGRPVKIMLTSNDVIHSFWVPKLSGKVDMIPGRTNKIWLQADEPGIYYGQCAEFCGDSHAKMRFRVVAMAPAEYATWLKERKAGPKINTSDPVIAKGREVFEVKANCWACHTIDGTKANGTSAPNLTDIGSRTTVAAGILENTTADGKLDETMLYENLKAWIADPPSFKPGTPMPIHKDTLTPEELDAVVRYLQSLK